MQCDILYYENISNESAKILNVVCVSYVIEMSLLNALHNQDNKVFHNEEQ